MTNRVQLPTNQLHNINWSALDHASRAPQLIKYHVTTLWVCVYERKRVREREREREKERRDHGSRYTK